MCATYADGFRATAVCPVGGPFASLKARKTGEALLKRFAIYCSLIKHHKKMQTCSLFLGFDESSLKVSFEDPFV